MNNMVWGGSSSLLRNRVEADMADFLMNKWILVRCIKHIVLTRSCVKKWVSLKVWCIKHPSLVKPLFGGGRNPAPHEAIKKDMESYVL